MAWIEQLWGGATTHWAWTLCAAGLSIAVLVGSLVGARFALLYLPADYFLPRHPQTDRWRHLHPAWRWTLLVGKNLLGAVLVALGLVMALPLVPGQGLLTLVIGLLLVDFPGKRSLEAWLIGRPAILTYVNRLRAGAGRPPLEMPARLASRGGAPGSSPADRP